MQLAEESVEYNINPSSRNYLDNQLIKDILQDKKEATKFINQFVKPRREVKEEELVKYTNYYMTKKYKSKEADLIYKLKNQEIFFVIEHQSTVDNNMLYRMLNYCLDIMQEWNRNRKIGKNTSYPIIVPIIIYTGNQKWKMPHNFKQKQISDYVFERYEIEMECNFIDINKLPKQILLEKDTMFGHAMFLEKANSYEEVMENLETIIKSTKNKRNLKELANVIMHLLDNVLEEEIQQNSLEKREGKEGEKSMSTLLERLRKEALELMKQGKEEKQKEIAKNMINLKLDEKIILETTEIKREELEKIKNSLTMAS